MKRYLAIKRHPLTHLAFQAPGHEPLITWAISLIETKPMPHTNSGFIEALSLGAMLLVLDF